MRITDIKSRRHRMSALFLDGNPVLIDTETLLISGLRNGDELSDEELSELKRRSDLNRAYEKALYLLEYRAHSRKELFQKLRAVFAADVCENAIERVEALGLIDDEAFARDFGAELIGRKRFGIRRAKAELERRGIDRDTIDEVLSEFEIDPIEQICSVIRKKYLPLPDDQKGLSRIYAAFARMGYDYSDIRSAIEEINNE